jgi:hypothetical protein
MAGLAAAAMGISGYDAGAGAWFKRMLALVTLAVGGSATVPTAASSNSSLSISVMPLTFTLAGFAVFGWVIAHRLKRSPHTAVDFTLQAVRAIIVMALALTVLGVVARRGQPGADDYIHVKVAYTAFFGSCVTLATLGVTYFVAFGATLPATARMWRDRLVGPAIGIFIVVVITVLGGTIYALVQMLVNPHHVSEMTGTGFLPGVLLQSSSSTSRRSDLAMLLGFAPNQALWMLTWAMGVPLTFTTAAVSHALTIHKSHSLTLTSFTNGDQAFGETANAVYWILLPLAALVWLIGAAAAALFAPTPREGRRNGYRLPLLAPLLTSAIFVMAGLALRAHHALIRVHIAYGWAFLLGLIWAGAAGALAPELVLRLPTSIITALRKVLSRVFGATTAVPAPRSPAPSTDEIPRPVVPDEHN